MLGRLMRLAMVAVLAFAMANRAAAQAVAEADRLEAEANRLHQAGRHADGIPLAQRALQLREKAFGPEHADVARSLNDLAEMYRAQGRTAEAEPLYSRALAIEEKAHGADHPNVARILSGLAWLRQSRGQLDDAGTMLRRALEIRRRTGGDDDVERAGLLDRLSLIYWLQGRSAQAETGYKAALQIREKARGATHPDLVASLEGLALVYAMQSRYSEAEEAYKRTLDIRERSGGLNTPGGADALAGLASLYGTQGRYGEAEALYKRVLAIRESVQGLDSPDVASTLQSLISFYDEQGRRDEAQLLRRRMDEINRKTLAAKQIAPQDELAALMEQAQRGDIDTETLLNRSIKLFEERAPENIFMGQLVRSLALLYNSQDRFADAAPLFERALRMQESATGRDSTPVASILENLGWAYSGLGDLKSARDAYNRSLNIRERTLGPDHPQVGQVLSELAQLSFAEHDWPRSVELWRRSTGMIARRAQRGLADQRGAPSQAESQRASWQFRGLVKALGRVSHDLGDTDGAAAREAFQSAQWVQGSEAAESLSQMAARGAGRTASLAGIVRERQDLVGEWQAKDKQLSAARSEASADRNIEVEKIIGDRLTAIDTRLAEIDTRLARDFPDYGALTRPGPIPAKDVQAALRDDEALILFLDTGELGPLPEETFVWVVTKSTVRWISTQWGTQALKREVTALRCGLDATSWTDATDWPERDEDEAKAKSDQIARRDRCRELTGTEVNDAQAPPFDTRRAHELYLSLFGKTRDLLAGKHLLVVPSGALTTLPFHVLVTKAPSSPDLASAAWMIRDHAITVLPSVGSLTALRRTGRPSAAPRPMLGFANPLLDGDKGNPKDTQRARRARAGTGCADVAKQRTATLRAIRRGAGPVPQNAGLADLAHLRMQAPLPETADEVCEVARSVGADTADMRIGARATEAEVKRLSESGELAQYRVLHFATHGLLAGQLDGTREPGLILTPPAAASPLDDGYLSASEIGALKLDADWVILSACNTAGGAGEGEEAEALSGLARVFFYAGARALLVSHWEVDSSAAVTLVTRAVGALAKDKRTGRAEALRQAMLSVMSDKTRPRNWVQAAHPAVWAPFVVVGEGSAEN